MVAVLGLFVHPRAPEPIEEGAAKPGGEMREDLTQALTREFEQALDRDLARIGEAIALTRGCGARNGPDFWARVRTCSCCRPVWSSWPPGWRTCSSGGRILIGG